MDYQAMTLEEITQLSKKLRDEGKIIEAGFVNLCWRIALPADTSDIRMEWLRVLFFAGADHLYSFIGTALGPGTTPENDTQVFGLIYSELKESRDKLESRYGVGGN